MPGHTAEQWKKIKARADRSELDIKKILEYNGFDLFKSLLSAGFADIRGVISAGEGRAIAVSIQVKNMRGNRKISGKEKEQFQHYCEIFEYVPIVAFMEGSGKNKGRNRYWVFECLWDNRRIPMQEPTKDWYIRRSEKDKTIKQLRKIDKKPAEAREVELRWMEEQRPTFPLALLTKEGVIQRKEKLQSV